MLNAALWTTLSLPWRIQLKLSCRAVTNATTQQHEYIYMYGVHASQQHVDGVHAHTPGPWQNDTMPARTLLE